MDRQVTVHYSQEDWDRMKERGEHDSRPFYTKTLEEILFQVAEHYGYHVGQIVVLTKLLQANQESVTGYSH